jgi:hypothetical protein
MVLTIRADSFYEKLSVNISNSLLEIGFSNMSNCFVLNTITSFLSVISINSFFLMNWQNAISLFCNENGYDSTHSYFAIIYSDSLRYFWLYCNAMKMILFENEHTNTNFSPWIYLLGALIFVSPQLIVFDPSSSILFVYTMSTKLSKSSLKWFILNTSILLTELIQMRLQSR